MNDYPCDPSQKIAQTNPEQIAEKILAQLESFDAIEQKKILLYAIEIIRSSLAKRLSESRNQVETHEIEIKEFDLLKL